MSGCHSGQHWQMPIKLVQSFYTVGVKGRAQETVNAVEGEFDARGYASVKVDV